MPHPASDPSSGIFICYRREDSSGHAGRLFDKLADHFGKDRIFMDIDALEGGEDFVTAIENALASCRILLAIIGRHWLTISEGSSRKLDNPNDFIRFEIVAALDRNIRVIPVLVQGATMPKPGDLPADLVRLARRHALRLEDDKSWHGDVDDLIGTLEKVLADRGDAGNGRTREGPPARQSPLIPVETGLPNKSKVALTFAGIAAVAVLSFGLWLWSTTKPAVNDSYSPPPISAPVNTTSCWKPAGEPPRERVKSGDEVGTNSHGKFQDGLETG
jgi:hypothetical protein